MASSKTLTPTNVTISIPAMTDVPDASVFSNCVDKEADAINALNNKFSLEAVNITYESDITGMLFVRKKNESNPVVTINGYVNFTNAPTASSTLIGTIPAGSRPGSSVRLAGALASAAYSVPSAFAYVIIDTDGTIKITPPSGNTLKSLYFSCAYHAQR